MSHQNGRIPTRTCVICRERRERGELLRIVRTPEGRVVFDETGRMNGRGAYVCGDADHWGATVRGNGIDAGRIRHALKTNIDESTAKQLSEAINSYLSE